MNSHFIHFFLLQELDALERLRFLDGIQELFESNEPLLEKYRNEITRLSEQLPLIEAVSRREFLKYRLSEFKKTTSDPSYITGSDGAQTVAREERQRREMEKELQRITDSLLQEIPLFERKHRCDLLYRGYRYVDNLSASWSSEILYAPPSVRLYMR